MQIRKKSVNTSKTILYFMYSNTIYILNNTIIEWFDIVLNITKRRSFKLQKNPKQTKQNKKSPSEYSLPPCPKSKHHIFFFSEWINETNVSSDWLSLIPIAHTDNGIEKKNPTFTITAPKKWHVWKSFWSVMMVSHYLDTQKVCIHIATTELGRRWN